MITRLTFDQISTAVHDAYEACKDIKGGQNAHYIPYLANINPSLQKYLSNFPYFTGFSAHSLVK